jgi:hypothetical protein
VESKVTETPQRPPDSPGTALIVLPNPDGGTVVRVPDAHLRVRDVRAPGGALKLLEIVGLPGGVTVEVPIPERVAAQVGDGLKRPIIDVPPPPPE